MNVNGYGIGRRKCAVAQVYIFCEAQATSSKVAQPEGHPEGRKVARAKLRSPELHNEILINGINANVYFQNDLSIISIYDQIFKPLLKEKEPLQIRIRVSGGGQTGQKDAIILALARAVVHFFKKTDNKAVTAHQIEIAMIKGKGLLTQDSRIKERKKYGLKKARKAPQYSKR
uniref:Small ribosomal subunit protein uS9c n=1 Tax=Rhipiliopsis peltata TaxID=2320810 RepID=A0A386B1C2_9CHLO|nr:ribosomal protein S9 [Rhipiliopsis peltata]AYC65487.1 ribosomal protein S9 [Rhipiliopsis peltata]